MVLVLMAAPALRSRRAVGSWPPQHAAMSGVPPSCARAQLRQKKALRERIRKLRDCASSQCGSFPVVQPIRTLSAWFTSAPLSTRIRATFVWPLRAAKNSAVLPSCGRKRRRCRQSGESQQVVVQRREICPPVEVTPLARRAPGYGARRRKPRERTARAQKSRCAFRCRRLGTQDCSLSTTAG